MNAPKANLLNALTLIFVGLWGYFSVTSPTALIPVGFGLILLVCYVIASKKPNLNKLVAHIAVLFTLIILFALVGMRLPKSLDAGGLGLVRVIAMISTSVLALIYFVKNFIDSRKK